MTPYTPETTPMISRRYSSCKSLELFYSFRVIPNPLRVILSLSQDLS